MGWIVHPHDSLIFNDCLYQFVDDLEKEVPKDIDAKDASLLRSFFSDFPL